MHFSKHFYLHPSGCQFRLNVENTKVRIKWRRVSNVFVKKMHYCVCVLNRVIPPGRSLCIHYSFCPIVVYK